MFIAIFIGIKNGYLSFAVTENKEIEQNNKQKSKYQFLSKYVSDNQISQTKTNEFQNKINTIKQQNQEIDFSVYFRDFNNGPWLSYNSLVFFDGASLLKLPILVTYLKAAEKNESLLQQKVFYESAYSSDRNPDEKFDQTLNVGETYTIGYLLEVMTTKSDNVAKNMLQDLINELDIRPNLEETKEILGVYDETTNSISSEKYAGIFRILYNAEYLTPQMSEKALEILSRAEYKDGLVNKLPDNIKVSHKFGVRYSSQNSNYQLHDCGIIYATNPYSLCVMTIGNNPEKQKQIISEISKISFELFN
ncbi:MAG: serine hydrolase [Patescibacteria group bacterium]